LLGGESSRVGVVSLVVLGCVLRGQRLKKSTVCGKKCTPRENPGYAYVPKVLYTVFQKKNIHSYYWL